MEWWQVKLEQATYVAGYTLHVRYAGELEADVDLSDMLDHPFYAPLRDKKLFAQVRVDAEVPVLVWPNQIDLSPEFLYDRVLKQQKTAVPHG